METRQLARRVNELLQRRHFSEADRLSRELIDRDPASADGWLLLARASQQRTDFLAMAEHVQHALQLQPKHLDVLFLSSEAFICTGRIADARTRLKEIEQLAGDDGAAWNQLVLLYTQLGRHRDAYDCARRLESLMPGSLDALFSVASAAMTVGLLDEAETLLEKIISIDPNQAEAYYNRAKLRRQTVDDNHVNELVSRLEETPRGAPGEIPLCYALGKEYEDLGEFEQSFAFVARGTVARRARISYDVATDVAAMDQIIATFDGAWRDRSVPGAEVGGPIFVLGLPRSGTTLVDRILDAHHEVTSLGEVNDFAYAVMRAGGPVPNKSELIKSSADADLPALGDAYWDALKGYGETAPYLIDKTPGNFLYLGLIMQSLPAATVIHVRRHPMASGYAMYKALFRMGYPFSYDLEEIGHYVAAYHRLMEHWRCLWPGRFLDVDYEELVDDQESVSRRIIHHCGLPWSDACLTYYKNPTPTATASAGQVQQPVYRHARDLWREIEHHLEPLARTLKDKDISACL
jgi:tetratricopeptide (TPR) repeat protein